MVTVRQLQTTDAAEAIVKFFSVTQMPIVLLALRVRLDSVLAV